ncbi:MAG: hypothetical protein ABSG87_00935 [Verrucomicrobiota bacterium]|jgi:Ca2+/Na+ antiporter
MIQFFKEVYLAGFVIIFKGSRARKITYGAGSAIAAITLIEWLVLIGISGYIEMFLNKKLLFYFSKPVVIIAFFALFLMNQYVLFIRGHGIKFAREFDSLKKSRRILLIVSWAVMVVVIIVFFIFSAIAHRHFIGVDKS